MKYKLFFGHFYYPLGGYEDYKGEFDTIEEAKSFTENNEEIPDGWWSHIVFDDRIVIKGERFFLYNDGLGYKIEWKLMENDGK